MPEHDLLVLVLNREEHLESIMTLFVELGISGATIIDSVGMGRILAHDVPIFAGFRDMMVGNRPYNKTILVVIPRSLRKKVIAGIEKICGPLSKPGVGLAFILKLDGVWGMSDD